MKLTILGLLATAMLIGCATVPTETPLSLHPQNPHYFLYKESPAVLITSAEHYGAVLNLDFNYGTYLDTLRRNELNNTRIFTGAYVEPQGAFNISRNTLAPAPGRFIAPWARSEIPGYANGGNKFDLNRWDDKYFQRLKGFMEHAKARDIIVELTLFCPFYEESQWRLSPQNPINNVNNLGDISRTNVYTLDKHGGLLEVHDQLVRKIVAELNNYDNLYFEICNEPYFGGVSLDWQHHIVEVITQAEASLPKKHLISRNVANGSKKVDSPHPVISIYNFHYASPPKAVAENYDLGKVIGDNETGFRGTRDETYRMEAWEFILSGGALFNHLDYSFAAGFESGNYKYPTNQPGGGNAAFRKQMQILSRFMRSLDFIKMTPTNGVAKVAPPGKARVTALCEEGKQYGIYLWGGTNTSLWLAIPEGRYRYEWLDVRSGKVVEEGTAEIKTKQWAIRAPAYETDIALRITRR